MNKQQIEDRARHLAAEHGDWFYDVPLPHGAWTKGNQGIPHTRLKRIVQIVADTVPKPLSECRVLDLGCLEGQFAAEFALQGSEAVGIEYRESNIAKALFIKEALGLENLHFHRDDVRNISAEKYGRFDAVVCSGILYHLTAPDVLNLVRAMHDMAGHCAIIDTHISLAGSESYKTYSGHTFVEHEESASASERAKNRWASADNSTSFWFTRPSLVNVLAEAGFSSVYECFTPAHMNYGQPGIERPDRCTFVAIKGQSVELVTSPAANRISEAWPEGALSYAAPQPASIAERIRRRLLG